MRGCVSSSNRTKSSLADTGSAGSFGLSASTSENSLKENQDRK